MSRYQFRATDSSGQPIEGEIYADSTRQAIRQLEVRGLQVGSLSEVDSSLSEWSLLSTGEQQSILQLRAKTMENIRTWTEPISALAQETSSPGLSKKLQAIATKLASAADLEQIAKDKQTAELLSLAVQDITSRNITGDWLNQFTDELESRKRFWRDIWYPLVATALCILILSFLAVVVVPIFQQMYQEFGLQLPRVTIIVFAVSNAIYPNYLQTLAVAALVGLATGLLVSGLQKSGVLLRYFPSIFAGSNSALRAVGLITCNAAELVAHRYPLFKAIRQAAMGCGHRFYQSVFLELANEVEAGKVPQDSRNSRFIPPLLMAQLSTGLADRTQSRRLGSLYVERSRQSSRKFPMIIGQLAILSLGLVIGFVVIALFSPLIRLISGLSS